MRNPPNKPKHSPWNCKEFTTATIRLTKVVVPAKMNTVCPTKIQLNKARTSSVFQGLTCPINNNRVRSRRRGQNPCTCAIRARRAARKAFVASDVVPYRRDEGTLRGRKMRNDGNEWERGWRTRRRVVKRRGRVCRSKEGNNGRGFGM